VLDSYFNFMKKSNLVGNLSYDILKNWWWLTFLGHPVDSEDIDGPELIWTS